MKWWQIILLAVVCVWLQINFLGSLRPFGIVPNLFLIVIVYFGLTRIASEVIALAIIGGLLLDMGSGADFGLRMAFYSVLALAIVVLSQMGINLDNFGAIAIAIIVATALFNLAILLNLLTRGNAIPWPAALSKVGIEVAANLVLAALVRPIAKLWRPQTINLPKVQLGGRR